MLTGEHPFRRSLAADTAVAILGNQPASIRQLRPEVGEELESVVMKLLVKQREDRWQSIEEVRTSLAQLVSDPSSSSMPLAAGKGTAFSRLASRVTVALVAVAAVAVAWLWFSRPQPDPLLRTVPLTSLPGMETHPSFSPDGNNVAFAWNGENEDNWDIYVKQIGTGARHRLTDDPASDTAPAWSPDELNIAFVRNIRGRPSEIRLIPSRGGTDRKVTEILLSGYPLHRLVWSRDSQWLAISARENSGEPPAIFLVSISSGEKRRLTSPDLPAEGGGDTYPAFSPDNRRLAFARDIGATRQIYLLDLSEDYRAAGEPVQLTRENGHSLQPVWTLDGREIIFAFGVGAASTRLYRIPVTGSERMRPLNLSHEEGKYPALSAQQDRLAFVDMRWEGGILRVELPGPGESWSAEEWKPHEFKLSTRGETRASYSHDGERIALVSLQTGSGEIWVCNSDGTRLKRLTMFNGSWVNAPRWSPDGEQISFMCRLEGSIDICVIGSGGGSWENLTGHPANDGEPSWSRDGQWIYFSSDRSGEQQIWKMPAAGGEAEQVTESGGGFALESPDGETLYISRDVDRQRSLWKMPVGGSEESFVSAMLGGFTRFSVADLGVYFFSDSSTLQFLPFDTGKAIPIVSGLGRDHVGERLFSVSPDGRWALLLSNSTATSDLMLVENFR